MRSRGRKSAVAVVPWERARRKADPQPATHEPSPPPEQPDTKAWWNSIVTDYELEHYQLHVLQSAGEAWDLYQQARSPHV